MIMGDICIWCCLFCDVGYGWLKLLDVDELINLVIVIVDLWLKYVVIILVDCDDLCDGGVQYFVDCLCEICKLLLGIQLEILVFDYCGCMDIVLEIIVNELLDVFNYNLEMVLCLYCFLWLGLDFEWLLDLLQKFKQMVLYVLIKFGLMFGLGEIDDEVIEVMQWMCEYDIDMLIFGQYLQLLCNYLLVQCFVYLDIFVWFVEEGEKMGFKNVVFGLLVCLFYYVDQQVYGNKIG